MSKGVARKVFVAYDKLYRNSQDGNVQEEIYTFAQEFLRARILRGV